MTAHAHQWLADRSRGNFTCAVDGCLVKGYAPSITSWQHRGANQGVKVYMCRAYIGDRKTGRHRCGAEATFVCGDRGLSRCAEHQGKAVGE